MKSAYQINSFSFYATAEISTTGKIKVPKGHKHGTIIKVPLSVVDNLKKHKK